MKKPAGISLSVDVFGAMMEVDFTWYAGTPQTYWEPGEPDYIEINRIVNEKTGREYPRLTEVLNERQDKSQHPIIVAIKDFMSVKWRDEA